jgi:LuxR family transcriptional regulator, quorum-sensing system regulator SdiA
MMNQAIEMPFHLGPELKRAINRTDIFRLLRAGTRHHGFNFFILLRHADLGAKLNANRDVVLTNFEEESRNDFLSLLFEHEDADLRRLYSSITPFVWMRSDHPDLERNPSFSRYECMMSVPLHTPEGKRFHLILTGQRELPTEKETAEVMLDMLRIFNQFYEKILANENTGKLTAREREVVKWTSEGKTSAEIAIILGLSEHTINSHITAAVRKLNAVNRVHLVTIAFRNGLVF